MEAMSSFPPMIEVESNMRVEKGKEVNQQRPYNNFLGEIEVLSQQIKEIDIEEGVCMYNGEGDGYQD